MNLIIDPNPKDDQYSLNGALAQYLAGCLGGPTKVIRIYEGEQRYFYYEYNQEWIDLILESKRLIFPVPMWNFSIPAALKDFLDKTTQRGKLWDFDESRNYKGLLTDKSAFIIMTSGDNHADDSGQDFVVPYLKTILSFYGVPDIRYFRLGGVKNKNLIADKKFMTESCEQMLTAFNIRP